MNIVRTLTMSIATLLISACAAPLQKCPGDSPASEAKVYQNPKKTSHAAVNGISELIDTREEFHDAAFNPLAYTTQYPLYLLGIEKPRYNSGNPYPIVDMAAGKESPIFKITNLKASADDLKDIESVLDDPRPLVLTHVLNARQINSNSETLREGCFIYNVYQDEKSVPWCKHYHPTKVEKGKKNWPSEGWRGLDQLGEEIKEAAKRENATHIIMLATGWNTVEYESFRDFSYWMKQLAKDFEGKGNFRPIFVGISWESAWPSDFWAKMPFGSWSTKGNDADAIGFTWANYLLNDVLKPIALNSGAEMIAIGHSFGSRIVFGAHYVRDILIRKTQKSDTLPITLIGLQAAFPTGRFTLTEGWEHPYGATHKDSAVVVITTSSLDEATGTIGFGTAYVGGSGGLKTLDGKEEIYKSVIALPVFRTDESGQPATAPSKNLVSVYDATPFVKCELPDTASGAHSDVYDQEMGHFMGEVIRASSRQCSHEILSQRTRHRMWTA
ncbi:MAG TPA: hypothetical protein P5330_03055, partial [Candidatus Competibacteraceae bacterium]|nr:hypothetical protein [Candidatus Competibacteraceae bacterium]